jgi:hypothetical protein
VASPDLPEPVVTGGEARRAVTDVLSRPEYAELEPNAFERARDALLEAIGRALDALAGTGAGTAVGYVALVILGGIVGLLAWRLLRGLRPDVGVDGPLSGDVGRSSEQWAAESEAHEQAGRFRDAVRCRYRALIAALAGGGLLDEIPGRTAGEYLTAVRADIPAAAEPFATATRVFEAAWYGPEEVTAAHAAAAREATAQAARAAGVDGRGAAVATAGAAAAATSGDTPGDER